MKRTILRKWTIERTVNTRFVSVRKKLSPEGLCSECGQPIEHPSPDVVAYGCEINEQSLPTTQVENGEE